MTCHVLNHINEPINVRILLKKFKGTENWYLEGLGLTEEFNPIWVDLVWSDEFKFDFTLFTYRFY